jgi:hypothetical protein
MATAFDSPFLLIPPLQFLETYFFFYVEIIINDQQWIYFTAQFTLLLSDII